MFEETKYFFLLILLMFFIFLYYKRHKKIANIKKLSLFGQKSHLPSPKTRNFFFCIYLLCFGLIIAALANPYLLIPKQIQRYANIRIFFLIDVSKSMEYAEDIAPTRLLAVKKDLLLFCSNLQEEYNLSIIPFSGTPNLYYCPLTYSQTTVKTFLEALSSDSAPSPGTDISRAIVSLESLFKDKGLDKEGRNLIFLISDGGKEESEQTNKVDLFKSLRNMTNSQFYAIGVGGDKPAPLIRRDSRGGFFDYVREFGKIAYSSLDEDILKQISAGNYIRFAQENILTNFVEKSIKESRGKGDFVIQQKHFSLQSYLFGSAAFLLILTLIWQRKY